MDLRFVYPAKRFDQGITVHPHINDLRRLIKQKLNLQVPCRSIQISKMDRQGNNTVETRYNPQLHKNFMQNLRDSYFLISILHNDLGEYICTGEELGSGAFSQVYRGYKKSNPNELVAIKVIDNQLLTNQKAKEYHENEKSILRILRHPNIVKVHDIVSKSEDNEGLFYYFVMEFCSGGSLESHISGKPLGEPTARRCLAQLAQALEHLYQNNIIHRDLKPGNILLSGPDICTATLKLCDFGFSRFFAPNELMQSFPLSPLYASPQLLFQRPYDPRSDLWSVGVIFYEMLTGATLFKEVQTMEQLHKAINNQDWKISIPTEIRKNLSSECISLVHLLLEREESRRISWEQFFKHPFLQSVSTRGIFNSADGEGYEVLVGEHTNVLSLKDALAPMLKVPSGKQIILLEDEEGTEIANHTILSTMGKAWELRTPMYLYNTQIENKREPSQVVFFPIDNTPPSPIITTSSEAPIRNFVEISKDFEYYSQRLKNVRKVCEKIITFHKSISKPMRNQIKSLHVVKLNFDEVTKRLAKETDQYSKIFDDMEEKVLLVMKEYPIAVDRIKRTSLVPALCKNSRSNNLWDAIDGAKHATSFEKLKLTHQELLKWFGHLKTAVDQSKRFVIQNIDENRLTICLRTSEELGRDIDSAIMVCEQDYSRVIKETENERIRLQSGLPNRTDIHECCKQMLDSCRLQLERAEEAYKTIHKNLTACMVTKYEVAGQIATVVQSRMMNLEILRENPSTLRKLLDLTTCVRDLNEQVIALPSAYQSYLEEMSRRSQFEDNFLRKGENFKALFDSLVKEENLRLMAFNKCYSKTLNPSIFVGIDRVEQKNASVSLPFKETSLGNLDVIKSYYQQTKHEDFESIMAEFEGTDSSQLRNQNQQLRTKLVEKERELEEYRRNDFMSEAIELRNRISKIEERKNEFFQQYESRFEELKRKANNTPQPSPTKPDPNLLNQINELTITQKETANELMRWKKKFEAAQNEVKKESDGHMDLIQRLEEEMKLRRAQNIEVQNMRDQLSKESAERVKEGLRFADLSKKMASLEAELSDWKSRQPNSKQQEELSSKSRAFEISHKEMMDTIAALRAKVEVGNSSAQKLEALMKMTKFAECPFCSEFVSEDKIQEHVDEKHN